MVRHIEDVPEKKNEPCPAKIEDACPIPRYRCKERGVPGEHCEELFAEFEMFVLPDDESSGADLDNGMTMGSDDLRDALGNVAESFGLLPPDEAGD